MDAQPFTTRSALSAGFSHGRLRGRDLEHPFQGVYMPTSIDVGVAELCAALAKRVPPDAFFCGPTAAMLYGVPLPLRVEREYRTHVAVPAPATAPVGRGIAGHSYRVVDREIQLLGGVRVSTPARTWCELSFVLALDDLIAAGDFLIHRKRPLTSGSELSDMVGRFPARSKRRSRQMALLELSDRSESPQETKLRLVLLRAGFRGLEVNHPIRTSGGFDYFADFAFPVEKVLIEYQSAFHETGDRYGRDKTRRSRLEADQWMVIEVTADDLRNPRELVDRIERVLAARSRVASFVR